MKLRLFYVFALFITIGVHNANAQSANRQPLKLVKYNDNVKSPLTNKELSFIKEVYADKVDAYVLSRPQKVKDLKNLLRNRILIKDMPELIGNTDKYKTLSEAGLFNNYNSNLTFDKVYNKDTFNVLKYNLEFFGRGSRIYRIDNTSLFIVILSQHQ
ncbi:hypothetical protein CLV86_2875 [Lacinutrix venerupis]|uniref:hypothetical protein n=1 Tax=Lacinutrix venerupis TaxID=1486034 RepID=UPI000EAE6A65|nr:hypothetical protein [Lacinutrix venerupis]RLJ59810.1 hypothetical protein CLV86_2875 [Lacinutrix venerupis]